MSDAFFQGERVGRYELVTRLSIGGMAELFLARLEGPGGFQKLVALKMILPDVASDERFVQMFLDEARLSAELSHPNLGQVFDLGRQTSGELYLAMEFLSGQNLGAVMRAAARGPGRLPLPVIARIVRDVCLGLHAAHSHVDGAGAPRPVIHRDVAPKNVMVTFDGHVKVIDFGIAHASGRRSRTQTGVVKGTPSHMAPEQLAGEPPTPATDVYAVGVMLYECLIGDRLFADGNELARFSAQPPPSSRNADLSPQLDAVCLKALAVEPERRYQTAREFAKALTEVVPSLADEEELSTLMAELFPGQRADLARLAESARDPAQPSQQLSKLARRVLVAEATPAALPEPSVTRKVVARSTPRSDDELPFLSSPDKGTRRILAGGAALSLVVTGVLTVAFGNEAEPVALVADGPLPGSELRRPQAPPPPVEAPKSNETLIVEAERALSRADVDTAEALLRQCKVGTSLCPRAMSLLPGFPQARRHAVLLEGAKHSLSEGDLEKADQLLAEVGEATLLRARALELRTLRAAAVTARLEPPAPDPSSPEVARLLQLGKDAKRDRQYGPAIAALQRCLTLSPRNAECAVTLASTYATRGNQANDERDNLKARQFYELFLKVCAPGDPRISRVKEILRGH